MFLINTQLFEKGRLLVISSAAGYGFEILPDYGAALNALTIPDFKREKFWNVIDGYSNTMDTSGGEELFKGVLLFPFGNRLMDGRWSWSGSEYQFPINEPVRQNSNHGMLYNRSFEIVETYTSTEMAFVHLRYTSPGSDQAYPFRFKIEVTYLLTDTQGLTVKTSVTNLDQVEFPFGLGWHPYFKTGSKVDLLKLKLPDSELLDVDERMIPTGRKSPFLRFSSGEDIGDTFLDSGLELKSDGTVETILYDPIKNIRIILRQSADEEDFGFIQVYTPPHRQSIALEPMTMAANGLATRSNGIIVLEPGGQREFTFHIGY